MEGNMLPEKIKKILLEMKRSGESEQSMIADFCFDVSHSMEDEDPIEIIRHLITCLEGISSNAQATAIEFQAIVKQLEPEIDINSLHPEDLLKLYERVSKKIMALYKGTI
jgi:hypothetical protein